ncbi:MAG: hypothetical protein J6Y02_04130 [Pseudobutyrivibrio sp.]|nr:hypothetical protein [Pseudobutyrivibrio sp.]
MDSNQDDPIWEYVVVTKLQPYIAAVRHWWELYDKMQIVSTGVFPVEYDDIECPPGLMMRMTNTAVRSPIKHVQAFPFVPSSYLQIAGVSGGVNRMIERVCQKGLTIEEFTIVEKHNLPSSYQKGQILCFVPTDILAGTKDLGKYVYMTVLELCSMAKGKLPQSVQAKCYQYIK